MAVDWDALRAAAVAASELAYAPYSNYRVGAAVHASRELKIHNKIHVLSLCHDLTGNSLLTSFYVEPELAQLPAYTPTRDDLIEQLKAAPTSSALNLQIFSRGRLRNVTVPAQQSEETTSI